MTIEVWADVGGTFTDCFVTQAGRRTAAKLLSTGRVYATLVDQPDHATLQLQSLPADEVPGFWNGAAVSLIQADGSSRPLGTVTAHDGRRLTLAADAMRAEQTVDWPELQPGASVEIDAALEAPVLATRVLLQSPLQSPLPPLEVRLGTTRGTNALLTRSGAATALVVTAGFADVLRIGQQDRPDLFALSIQKPPPLAQRVVEVDERLDAGGAVIRPPDLQRLRRELNRLRDSDDVQSLAICLLHAHVNDAHERAVETLARELGFTEISRSSEVAPLIKLVSRAETTTLDAYLNPILAGYVARVWDQFGGVDRCRLRMMTSSGNLVAPHSFRGRDSILSGPAGGVVALAHVARRRGATAAIGLDMGGTSTDVSRFEGQVGRRFESRVAGIRVMTPMMDIQTVAAGGGSICDCLDGRLLVGPASAGADPGPACYGRGGPLTVTDVNLLLGRIPTSRFPFALDRDAARRRLDEIVAKLGDATDRSAEHLAEGFLEIAVTHMAEAVRTVSTAVGSDVRRMALVGFGGAAGQHLCRVAAALGMQRILDHPHAGMLSALGMGLADVGRVVTCGVYQPLTLETVAELPAICQRLQRDADDQLRDEATTDVPPTYRYEADVRYQGTESPLTLTLQPAESLVDRFHQQHQQTFGYHHRQRAVELVAVRCEATLRANATEADDQLVAAVKPNETVSIWHGDRWVDAALVDRASVQTGDTIAAPAMIVGDYSTLLVEPGWQAVVLSGGTIEMTPVQSDQPTTAQPTRALTTDQAVGDPVLLEVVARRLQGIADAMGEVLRRTSISVNVKERRDYSCAVFRGDGSLIANAPHVPVHLGAMGHTVRHMIAKFPQMSPGDCFLSNDPFAGGSHLPDVTLVTPVFCSSDTDGGKPDFFVASRAHHAEIGGRTPGSMPPDACSLAEEGVLIRSFALVRGGQAHWDQLQQLLAGGPYPSRCVAENLADIAAQQAAGVHGVTALRELADTYGIPIIDTLMGRLLEVAGDTMRHWIETLPSDPHTFDDQLDDGTPIGVTITRRGSKLTIDFASGPVHRHGFNATPAIVTAAVLYVLRCVAGAAAPQRGAQLLLCDGVLRDVELNISPGLLDPPADPDPARCAAVVAGNVETSQRIVDVLLGALGVAAASQGTMNNVLMGDASFGYYETIGGGSGATADADGADAVHTHMTNTRITDPEVIESRLPVRLHRFAIRRESGGSGKHRGGDGMIREFEFLRPLTVSLITGRRTCPPYGLDGGDPGQPGRNVWTHANQIIELPATATIEVAASDRLTIHTPGGGGYGEAKG